MLCYNCGCQLSEHDFCTACGADVALYKKIIYASNKLYNDGLEKAKVRDLTGAVHSLRQCLKLNKNHIKARNLLGLVYFEMGEAVAALSEWVISKNLKPQKNIADNYIDMLQNNAGRLETINQTIKKYNLSYHYCQQGSKDLAIIQLKKVLSLNPRLIRAHLLLALLFMDSGDWERARKEVRKCLDIDRNNTLALTYMQEIEKTLAAAEGSASEKHRRDESVRYQTDNEVIIQPVNVREAHKNSVATILNIVIGLVIGMAAMYFLVLPARISAVREESNGKVAEIGNQLDDKAATVIELEQRVRNLEDEKARIENDLNGYIGVNGTLDTIDSFLAVVSHYLENGDVQETGKELEEFLENVDITQMSDAVQQLHQALHSAIGPKLGADYYNAGITALRQSLYDEAINNLEMAVYYDEANAEPLFELGNAYREKGRVQDAVEAYEKLISLFPDSSHVKRAQGYINELTEE